jgi:FkbM family methyltransferase
VRFDEAVENMYAEHFSKSRFYENEMLNYIRSLDLSGTYLDIGAHVGNHAVFFGMFCKSSTVVAFEPLSRYVTVLNKNLQLNRLQPKSVVIPVALSDGYGTTEILWEGAQESVLASTLDAIMGIFSFLDPVVVIKVDIEGMESKALLGARDTIKMHKPLIFAEAHYNTHDVLFETMERLGYHWSGKVFNASPTYEFTPFKERSLTTDLISAEKRLKAAMSALEREREQLRVIRSSVAYQSGYALTQAVGRPGYNTVVLPCRLFWLALKAVRARRAPPDKTR